MEMALAFVAIILAVPALILSVYSVIMIKSQQLSTHRVEFLRPSTTGELKAASGIAEPPYDKFDNIDPSFVDNFNVDEAGI